MNRKVLSLLLCIALTLSLCACGSKTEEPAAKPGENVELDSGKIDTPAAPETPEADPLPEGNLYQEFYGETNFNFYTYYNDDAQVWAGIEGIEGRTGKRLWTFETEPCYVGQLDTFTVIGPTVAGFVFTQEDTIFCLNPVDGSLEWKTGDLGVVPAGYYTIDDDCNFYLPGFFSCALVVIGSDGRIVNKFENIQDIYDCDIEGWCQGIELGGDGMMRMYYYLMSTMTYKVDPKTGLCVDEYPYSMSITPEMLIGTWVEGYYSGESNMNLYVDEDLNFVMTTFKDNSVFHVYNGHFVIDTFVEDVGNDWLLTVLDSTDDDMFSDWGGIGDFVVNTYYVDTDGEFLPWLELTQVNNGDSVMSYYFDEFQIILNKVEAVG